MHFKGKVVVRTGLPLLERLLERPPPKAKASTSVVVVEEED